MTITYDLDLRNFKAWSGAISTLNRIIREDKCELLEEALGELYPNGIEETQLNDLLWFDSDCIYELVGMITETQLEEQIEELKEQLEDLQSDYEYDIEDMEVEEIPTFYKENYEDDINELKEQIEDLKEQLSEL